MLSVRMKNGVVNVFTGKLEVEVKEDDTVTLNGEVEIKAGPDGNGYTLSYPDMHGSFALRNRNSKGVVGVEYDPYWYKTAENGLSVEDSTSRAYDRVIDMLPNDWYDLGTDGIWEAIKQKIRNGDGRQSVYVLAGGIVKGWKEGLYKGVPFGYILQGFVDGKIESPEPEPKPAVKWVPPRVPARAWWQK